MEGQEIEESQQIELRLWRDKAQKAKIARLKALAKLEALATTRPAPDKAKASSGIQRASLASSIEQLVFCLEAMKRRFLSTERRLLEKLHNLEVEQQKYRRWQVEDIKMVLEGTVKPTTGQLDSIRNISSSADLIEQCAGDNKLAKYYSDAFGQYILLLGALSTVFHLPIRNQWKYQGIRSEIWLPSTFYEYKPEQRTSKPHVLCLTAPSGSSHADIHRKEILQAVGFLERSAAVSLSIRPEVTPRRSIVVTPLEWISDVCEASMREKKPNKEANDHLQQSVVLTARGDDGAVPVVEEDKEEEKENVDGISKGSTTTPPDEVGLDDGDWELLMAADTETGMEIEGESSYTSLISMVNRVRTFAYSYTGR